MDWVDDTRPRLCNYGKNFYIKNGKAFTEDHVMVYKILVRHIPFETTIAEIKKYFLKYGEMERINTKNKSKEKMALIQFENASSAAQVFAAKDHFIGLNRIEVEAFDSWKQPGVKACKHNTKKTATATKANVETTTSAAAAAAAVPSTSDSCSNEDSIPPPDSLLTLNYDCVVHIMNFLDLLNQVNLARTCTTMSDYFEEYSKSHKNLKLEQMGEMTLWEIYDYFGMAGKHLTSIEGKPPSEYCNNMFKYININCNNMTCLSLVENVPKVNILKKCLWIVDLSLVYCKLTDDYVEPLRELRSLKKLDLSENSSLEGKYFSTLSRTIEVLTLKQNNKLKLVYIIAFFKALSNLEELNCACNSSFGTIAIENMAEHCKQLKVLNIDFIRNGFATIAKLPNLKNLTINTSSAKDLLSTFEALKKYQADQLEHLTLDAWNCFDNESAHCVSQLNKLRSLYYTGGYNLNDAGLDHLSKMASLEELVLYSCDEITNNAVIRLVLGCKTLTRLCLGNCNLITDKLIYDLIDKMRAQINAKTFQRQEPIKLSVPYTKINEFILKDAKYKSASDLIIIDFASKYIKNDHYNYTITDSHGRPIDPRDFSLGEDRTLYDDFEGIACDDDSDEYFDEDLLDNDSSDSD